MVYTLENEHLTVQLTTQGAELTYLYSKDLKINLLWNANKDIWARHAPVLFPIVGKVQNNRYRIGDKTYALNQHGFARDQQFEVILNTSNEIVFELKSNERFKDIYPYEFCLRITYQLEASAVSCSYSIHNLEQEHIYFSIGAHPGFSCPFFEGENFEDYFLEFDLPETKDRILLSEAGYRSGKTEDNYLNNSKHIYLDHSIFDNDALIFQNLASSKISLKSKQHKHAVSVSIEGFPYIGIWSKPKSKAPFVCLEPWFGITDQEEGAHDFTEKEGVICLEPNKQFDCKFSIQVE